MHMNSFYLFFLFLVQRYSYALIDDEHPSPVSDNLRSTVQCTPLPEFVRPENPPRYFAVDIDGTFFTTNEESYNKNVETFAKLRQRGLIPFFSTGRSFWAMRELLTDEFQRKTGYNGYPGVYSNGASVYDEYGNLIYSPSFSREFLDKFIDFAMNNGLKDYVSFCSVTSDYALDESYNRKHRSACLSTYTVLTRDQIVEKRIVKLRILKEGPIAIDGTENLVDYVMKGRHDNSIHLTPPNVTKGTSIAKLMEHYNQDPSSYGYIGDGMNDIEAMELSMLSFAVGNAPDSVKKHAKYALNSTHDQAAFTQAMDLVYNLDD